jgi:hypothetical protein
MSCSTKCCGSLHAFNICVRSEQGLDPRCTANLFLDAVCIGEKTLNDEDCFILKLETASHILKAQSTPNTEIVHHTVWGYFSQRTGLLVQFEDTKLVRMKPIKGNDSVFWETSMESVIEDYKYVDGINIAHGGKTATTLYRYGESYNHKRKIEESWKIEEVEEEDPLQSFWTGEASQFTVRMALGEILRPSNCHVSYLLKYNKILFFSLKINKN